MSTLACRVFGAASTWGCCWRTSHRSCSFAAHSRSPSPHDSFLQSGCEALRAHTVLQLRLELFFKHVLNSDIHVYPSEVKIDLSQCCVNGLLDLRYLLLLAWWSNLAYTDTMSSSEASRRWWWPLLYVNKSDGTSHMLYQFWQHRISFPHWLPRIMKQQTLTASYISSIHTLICLICTLQ